MRAAEVHSGNDIAGVAAFEFEGSTVEDEPGRDAVATTEAAAVPVGAGAESTGDRKELLVVSQAERSIRMNLNVLGKFSNLAALATADCNSSLALGGTVLLNPIRGGSSDGYVRFP